MKYFRGSSGLFLLVFAFAGCTNQPPSTPFVFGPHRGRPDDTLVFSVISVDREGDSVAYLFEWSNQPGPDWSEWFPSGREIYRSFSFSDTGAFSLRVKARDHQHESDWSESLVVNIRWYLPSIPRKPAGPDTVCIGDTATYYSSALHPLNEKVAIQFSWGGALDQWSNYVLPGEIVSCRHHFDSVGLVEVRCRAKDSKGYVSDWSAPETVVVRDGQVRLSRKGVINENG